MSFTHNGVLIEDTFAEAFTMQIGFGALDELVKHRVDFSEV